MLLSGTIVVDPETVLETGAVVVDGDHIEAVGAAGVLREQYPDHEHRSFDIVAPGLVQAHIHSVQSLGRGMADDTTLLDWLFDHVLPMEASMGAAEMETAAQLGYLELLESGVTTCVDHLSVDHADRAIEAAGDLGIRARLGKVLMDTNAPEGLEEDTDDALAETEQLLQTYDGSYDDRIRYAITPRFAVTCTEACLRGCRDLADEYDVHIHTHASETRDEIDTVEGRTGMRNVEWLHEVGLTGEDVLLAHCIWTDDHERQLLAETDTTVVHCPSANMKLASGIAPIQSYLDRDIPVALGSDGPPCNNTLDPFTELRQASLLAKVDALSATALPASDVFRMATLTGARAAGFERVGALRAGWRADVIGISTASSRATPIHDPLSHLVFAAHGDDVELTMIDGTIRYDDGHVDVDANTIRERAREFAEVYS